MDDVVSKFGLIPGLTVTSISALYDVINVEDIRDKINQNFNENNPDYQIEPSKFANTLKIKINPKIGILKVFKNSIRISSRNDEYIKKSIDKLVELTGINNNDIKFLKIIMIVCSLKNTFVDMDKLKIVDKENDFQIRVVYKKTSILIFRRGDKPSGTILLSGTDPDETLEAVNFIKTFSLNATDMCCTSIDPLEVTDMVIEI